MGEPDTHEEKRSTFDLRFRTAFLLNLFVTVVAVFPVIAASTKVRGFESVGLHSTLIVVFLAFLLSQAIVQRIELYVFDDRARAAVLLAPSLLAVLLGVFVWTAKSSDDLHAWKLRSPSGKFIVHVDRSGASWGFTFCEANDRVITRGETDIDRDDDVLRMWDSEDRFWAWHVAEGRYYYWELAQDKWVRREWDRVKAISDAKAPNVPQELQ